MAEELLERIMNMRMTRHLRVSLNLGAALSALSVTQPAISQTAATPEVPNSPVATNPLPEQVGTSATTDGEIIVTAQRRSQNLRDVPVSVQAFGAEQLASAGVGSTDSLVALTPSLGVNKFLAPFQSSI
jgi:outer membrane receptor protein involved in Fe transport